jgi:very-short-patch-repair endonuclease
LREKAGDEGFSADPIIVRRALMTLQRSRDLRRNATDVERRLWWYLRGRRFESFKFRRERPIGPYIVDFVCLERRLIVELDGGQHAEDRKSYDERRDAYLRRAGYRVLRIWNNEVNENLDGVMQEIDTALRDDPHPPPSPASGRRDAAQRLVETMRAAGKHRRMMQARIKAVSASEPSPACGRGQGEGLSASADQ